MRLPKFDYIEPNTLTEASAILRDSHGQAQVLAGGTDLLVAMKNRVQEPCTLVNLKTVPNLNNVTLNNEEFNVGALVNLQEIAGSALLAEHACALVEAAGKVASFEIRQAATLGGNLALNNRCWNYNRSLWWRSSKPACYKVGGNVCYVAKKSKKCFATASADTPPALIALGATVVINGQRQLPVEDLFSHEGVNPNCLQPGDIISGVIIPVKRSGKSAFIKIANREVLEFPQVNCAVFVEMEGDLCKDITIAVSGVSMGPVKVHGAKAMVGRKLDEAALSELSEATVEEVKPISNSTCIDVNASYRRQLIKKAVVECLKKACQR